MTSPRQDIEEPIDRSIGRVLWERCRTAEVREDESVRFLDLAAFAEGGMDRDDYDRIAAQVLVDQVVAADVAAAQALRDSVGESSASVDRIVARALSLRADCDDGGLVVPFRRPDRRVALRGLAQWGSLAAALAVAAWLGFTMGSDASLAFAQPELSNGDAATVELFDPETGFLHDVQT